MRSEPQTDFDRRNQDRLRNQRMMKNLNWRCRISTLAGFTISMVILSSSPSTTHGMLADRSRLVRHRQKTGASAHYRDNGKHIEGQNYRVNRLANAKTSADKLLNNHQKEYPKENEIVKATTARSALRKQREESGIGNEGEGIDPDEFQRRLSSQLTGCCYNYQNYGAEDMCGLYGQDCEGGGGAASGSQDEGCSQDGLSFIGISFSVNTASGNPYSYQLCDQFPMENIIDRDYNYVMSMDEDGWLVGGGYKPFDYSGKMP